MTDEEIARQFGLLSYLGDMHIDKQVLAALAAARADERQALYVERGTLLFNPYSGTPRHPEEIKSDPHGILIVEPGAPIRALTGDGK